MRKAVLIGKVFTWFGLKTRAFFTKKSQNSALGHMAQAPGTYRHVPGTSFPCARHPMKVSRRLVPPLVRWAHVSVVRCWKCMFLHFFSCLLLCKMCWNLRKKTPPSVKSLDASWIFILHLPKDLTNLQMSCFAIIHDLFVNYIKTSFIVC